MKLQGERGRRLERHARATMTEKRAERLIDMFDVTGGSES